MHKPKLLRQNIGFRAYRTKYRHPDGKVNRERIFQEEWNKENRSRPGINYGSGLLQDLFVCDYSDSDTKERKAFDGPDRDDNPTMLPLWRGLVYAITPREHRIAATLIQWFGTNCGWGFLERCLKRCGFNLQEMEDYPLETADEIIDITSRLDGMSLEEVNKQIKKMEEAARTIWNGSKLYEPSAVQRTIRKLLIKKALLSKVELSKIKVNLDDLTLKEVNEELKKLEHTDYDKYSNQVVEQLKTMLYKRKSLIEGNRKMFYINETTA